ncbi:hypothetical protein AVEN_265208-1 [Araneus ventricosus]|uniref:Tc1-like transposase DDE domain-containing protein n=1 Tax=Araneus ventricosus TaxID=182803 RepID=A0A4Y2CP00_ARAVE|nr:hypothetical protein AVEN_265208-1 [Araneus ventricosus]
MKSFLSLQKFQEDDIQVWAINCQQRNEPLFCRKIHSVARNRLSRASVEWGGLGRNRAHRVKKIHSKEGCGKVAISLSIGCLRKHFHANRFENHCRKMAYPARSPDLNPKEHVWDMLGRRNAGRIVSPGTLHEFQQALLQKWALLPQQAINDTIASMPRSCQACISARGYHNRY